MITFNCPKCRQKLVVRENDSRQKVQCPRCQESVTTPRPAVQNPASSPQPQVRQDETPPPPAKPAIPIPSATDAKKTVAPVESDNTAFQQAETKQCPFCAEIIKSQAVVCRFCGRDVVTTQSLATKAKKKQNPGAIVIGAGAGLWVGELISIVIGGTINMVWIYFGGLVIFVGVITWGICQQNRSD